MAAHNMPEAFAKAHSSSAADFTSVGGALGGAMSTKRPVQITDLAATEAYKQRHPKLVEAVELGGIRTALAVPMLKDDVPIGVIAIIRPEVARLTTSRSNFSRASPLKQSLLLKTRGCSTNCASAPLT